MFRIFIDELTISEEKRKSFNLV